MKFLFKFIFCVPLFIILSNLIKFKGNVELELFEFYKNYIKISSFSPEILFWAFFTLFALSVLLIIFNFCRFFGIFWLISSLIFYYLFLDADFFVFGMIGGLLLLSYDVKSVSISKKLEKTVKKPEKIKKKLKNRSKSTKNRKVVDDKGVELVGATQKEDEIANRWKEYDLKHRPVRSRFEKIRDELFSRLKILKFFNREVKRSVFPEFVMLTVVICSCAALLIIVNLVKTL